MEEMVSVVEANQAISVSLDLASVMERASEAVARLIEADWAYILLPVEDSADEYMVTARYGWWGQHKKQDPQVYHQVAIRLADFSLLRHAILRNRQVLADEAKDYDQFERLHDLLGRPQSGPTLIQPLSLEDRIVGVMLLGRVGRKQSFGRIDCELGQLLAAQVAASIVNARLHRDVEERVQQLAETLRLHDEEAAWRQRLLESLDVGLVAWTADGEPLLINATARPMLGLVQDEPPNVTLERLYEQLVAAGEEPADNPLLMEWEGRMVEASLTPIRDAAGAAQGRVAVLRDVTAGHRYEQALRAYLATSARELHTGLTALRERLEPLAWRGEGALSPQQRSLWEEAKIGAERLVSTAGNLLIASELGRGVIEIDSRPVDMKAVMEQAVRAAQSQVVERRLDVTLSVPSGLSLALGEPAALRQIMDNLLHSALCFAEVGGRVTIWAAETQLEDDRELFRNYLVINIRNTGSGISSGDQERVSEAFYRAADIGTAEEAVSGMELAITRELVEAHGGRIWVESQPGAGSTFRFTIPAAPERTGMT